MKGLIIKHLGKEYRVGLADSWISVVCTLVLQRDEFILQAGDMTHVFISSFQKIRKGLDVEIEIAEFNQSSEPISESNPGQTDPEYTRMIDSRDEQWGLEWKLRKFREIETVLKEEGLI